jgi:Zn-dependent alcohol dehydrogenase
MIQAAVLAGAYPIIAVDRFRNRLDLATKIGATHVVDSGHHDDSTAIRNIMDGEGVDVFIDNTGCSSVIEKGLELTKRCGRVVLVGVPRVGDNICIHTLPLHFGKKICGSHGGSSYPNHDIPRIIRLQIHQRVELRNLITNRYPLSEINNALLDLRNGKAAGKCLIEL